MLSSSVAQFLAYMIDHTVTQVCALFVSSSSPCLTRTLSGFLSDLSIYFTFSLFITFSFLHFLLPFTFLFLCLSHSSSLMSWTKTTRTAAEELGPQDNKNSSTGYESNDHFVTEADVELTQESVTEPLLNACRRRADHSEGEGLSSCLSSSMSHDRTGTPVVCRDASQAQGHENSETKL